MSNKNNKKQSAKNTMARILCLVLVGLMVFSGAVLTIISVLVN